MLAQKAMNPRAIQQLLVVGNQHAAVVYFVWLHKLTKNHAGIGQRVLKTFRCDQRFENWKRLRAPGWPYFLRSRARGSRVRKPSAFSAGRRLASNFSSAREIPWRVAPAWPFGAPPVTFPRTSSLSAVPVTVNGCDTVERRVSSGK